MAAGSMAESQRLGPAAGGSRRPAADYLDKRGLESAPKDWLDDRLDDTSDWVRTPETGRARAPTV